MGCWRDDAGPAARWRWMERRAITNAADADVYMVRYTLVGTPWGDIKVHHILRPDIARDPHDHPWPFVAVILRGGYTEEVPYPSWRPGWPLMRLKGRRRRPGHIYRAAATYVHRLDEVHGDCWSLVVSGRRVHTWGFHASDGTWTRWDRYLEETA